MPGPQVRRVVTGHDEKGRSIISDDGVRQDDLFTLVWTTATFPADNTDSFDGGDREVGIALPGGTVCRVGELPPGARSPMHRTKSLDYGIVLSGRLDMELDGGDIAHLGPGDIVVQRGTNHAWINSYTEPCRMAWILVDAELIDINGQSLEPNS